MMKEIFSVIPELQVQEIEVILVCDSLCLCASLNPAKLYKSVKVRNACFLIHKNIADLVAKFPKVSVKYCHIKGTENSSDGASKLVTNPVAIANSQLWIEGSPCYKDPAWPQEELVFIQADSKNQTVYKPPKAQQHVDASINCVTCHNTKDFCGVTENENNSHNPSNTSNDSEDIDDNDKNNQDEENFAKDDEEQDAEFTTLPYEQYCRLLINSSSLLKVVNVVCLLTRLSKFLGQFKSDKSVKFKKLYPDEHCTPKEQRAAWRTIIRSSQKYFPPTNIASWYPYTNNNGILKARTRYQGSTAIKDIIQITTPPLVCHRDHRLATLIVRLHHIKKIYPVDKESPDIFPIHLPKNITIGNMRNSSYSAEITQSNRVVKYYIENCFRCVKLKSQTMKTALGTPRWLKFLQEQAIPYQVISVDPIGDYSYRPHPDSRGPVCKAYVLVVSCLLTTAVSCYVMQDSKKKDIYRALHTHFERFLPARVIYCDAGSNVNLHNGDKEWKQLFGNHQVEILRIGTEEFWASFVESKIKILKRLIKSAMNTRHANKLPTMTIAMLNDFFETICNLVNSRPLFCTPDGKFMLSANALTKSWIHLDKTTADPRLGDLDSEISKIEKQMLSLYDTLQTGSKIFMDNLKATLLSDTKNHKRLQNDSHMPKPCDVVLVIRKEGPVLGIVEETIKPYCMVRRKLYSSYISEKINVKKLVILHRPYLAEEPPAKNNDILELRKTRGKLQTRVDKVDPEGESYIVAPHSLDDVILHPSHQYYSYGPSGDIRMWT